MAFKIPESLQPRKPPSTPRTPSSRMVSREATARPLRSSLLRRPTSTISHPHAVHIPRRKPPSFKDLDKPSSSQLHSQQNGSSQQRLGLGLRRQLMPNSALVNRRQSVNRAATVARRRSSAQGTAAAAASTTRSSPSRLETIKRLSNSRIGTLQSGVDNRFFHLQQRPKSISEKSENEKQSASVLAKEPVSKMGAETKKPVPSKSIISKAEVARQLKRLVGRICEDDYAKYQLLDERDKIMCKGRVKNADVENATVTQGTCADMCPEKERYQRVVQKRMSTYECDESGNMVPELTVKDYSRSAADQEEPLPHELRPSYVLQRTMNYLISRIAEDIPSREEDLAQWYDFLWNRTRAIRKDITQQLMVNDIAVSLIEQCARLHIFASHRLCELGLNEFDQKMNTENLTKSLQSLRYLYDDLAKKGSYFASEAEFRAYDVLLNLNDSNILREVLTYRRDIRESPEIRLALRLFSCVQSGNYVRFFRLLKEKAAFLQCCLCHRYFAEIRAKALHVLTFSSHERHKFGSIVLRSTKTNRYPLRKLTELLGFDDETHASSTLGLHGVYLDGDDDEQNVILSKTSFYNPEEQIASKVHAWIEAKRGSRTITEVLSGGQRLKVDLPKATVSFDCSGAYVCDPVLCAYLEEAENEITKSDADDSTTSFTFSLPKTVLKTANQSVELGQYNSDPGPPPTVKREATIADEGENSMQSATQVTTSNMTAGNAFDAFTDGSFKSKSNIPSFTFALAKPRFGVESSSDKGQMGKPLLLIKREEGGNEAGNAIQKTAQSTLLNAAAEDAFNRIFDECLRPRCQEVLMSAKILYRHKLAQQAAQRRKEAVFELGRTILDQLLDDVTAAVANESARKQMRWERHAHDRKLLETIASKFCDGLLLEVVDVEVCALCALSMKENVFDVKIRLQQIATNLNRIWLKQFFDIWRSMVATRRERKQRQYEILAAFPTVLPAHSKFHVPRHIPFEKRPIIPDFTSVVVEQKINRFQEKRRKKIVKHAFDHWRRWTRLRIEASVFVKAFSRQAAMHLRKRRWSMIENRQADPFGLRGALNNEQEAQRRRFGPRLCDLESLSGESASKRASPPRSPQIAIGTPVGNSAGPFLRSLLTDFRSPSSKIWRFGTPVSRTSAQRGIFKISSFTPTGSTPGSSSLNSEKLQAGRVEKPKPLNEISKRVSDFMKELDEVSERIARNCRRSEEVLNESV